jgi:hypothetical protein
MISTFDVDQARAMLKPGSNTIRGSALIRQRGGGVVSCAGREVYLVPATEYAKERMSHIYGNTERGFNPAFGGRDIGLAENKAYSDAARRTLCDAQGYFRFTNVGNGEYFVATTIVWQVNPYFNEGGALMERVLLRGNETREVVLSP